VYGAFEVLSVALRHCTIASNSAGTGGGGIAQYGGLVRLENSIVAANAGAAANRDYYRIVGAVARSGHNVLGTTNPELAPTFPAGAPNANGDSVGTDVSPLDPLLAPLGDYGGLTPTRALLPGSPARDNSSASTVTSDQRGFPIVGVADIGAYEAGTLKSYTQWSWETLPASATAVERAPAFDLDLDGRNHALEFATLTDGSLASGGAILGITRYRPGTRAIVVLPCRYGIFGLRYHVDRSFDLNSWTHILTLFSGHDTIYFPVLEVDLFATDAFSLTFSDTAITGRPTVFYRLRIELD
jgi:hypothetical protein